MLTRPVLQDLRNHHRVPTKLTVRNNQARYAAEYTESITRSMTDFHRFPLSNFKYFLTLFSKFFSSFPHGTCSLSVSRQYLALDEIYHPIRIGIPTNPTLRTQTVRGELSGKDGILTLSDAFFQRTYPEVTRWHYASNAQLAVPCGKAISTLSSSRFTRRY